MGLLPLGTANDFATAAGIPDDALEALELVPTARPRVIDLLRLDAGGRTHWAANLASGRLGPPVTVETHDTLRQIRGGLASLVTHSDERRVGTRWVRPCRARCPQHTTN